MQMITNRVSEEIGNVEQNNEENSRTENVVTCEKNEHNEQSQCVRQASDQEGNKKIVAMEESILRIMEIVKETDIDNKPPPYITQNLTWQKSEISSRNSKLCFKK